MASKNEAIMSSVPHGCIRHLLHLLSFAQSIRVKKMTRLGPSLDKPISTVVITTVLYNHARMNLLVSGSVIQDQSASASLTILRGKQFGWGGPPLSAGLAPFVKPP